MKGVCICATKIYFRITTTCYIINFVRYTARYIIFKPHYKKYYLIIIKEKKLKIEQEEKGVLRRW